MKTIVITGGASGIGRATAQRLVQAGWCVGLFDINRAALDTLVSELGEQHCCSDVVDVTNADDMHRALAAFVERAGHLDAIFNCAGIMDVGHFEDIPLERHFKALDINIKGVLNGCHLAFPYLKEREQSWVISMSSASSVYGIPSLANYSATKFWVKGLTEGLNIEWRRHGIHVADIEPPFVRTPLLNGNQAPIIERMGVRLQAEDIAEKVYRALHSTRMHHPVSLHYRLLRLLRKLLPEMATRLVLRGMAGY